MPRVSRWMAAVVGAAALVTLGSPKLLAQQISISPNIGVYIPTAELVKAAGGEEFRQEISLLLGGRLGIGFGQRVGLAFTVDYSPSELRFNAGGPEERTPGNVLSGSGRLTLSVLPLASPVVFMLNGGASMVRRSGEAFEDQLDRTSVGGVAGATVGLRLGGLLSFYVHADDFIYNAEFTGPTVTEQVLQHDVHLSFGLGVPIGPGGSR
jgi:hypothetical protein